MPADLQAQPGLFGAGPGAKLTAEDDRGAAVIVGEDHLDQGGGSAGLRHGRGQDRGLAVGVG
jgi:hypothetical protein